MGLLPADGDLLVEWDPALKNLVIFRVRKVELQARDLNLRVGVRSVVVTLAGHNGPGKVLELGALVVWLGCGFVSIGVAAGGIDPRFDALDDRRAVWIVRRDDDLHLPARHGAHAGP